MGESVQSTGEKPAPVSAETAARAAQAPDVAGKPVEMPPALPVCYPKALKAMRDLTNDKENTAHVFTIVRNLNGRTVEPAFRRFHASEVGKRAMADPQSLLRVMDDRERMRALPDGTLGREYARFMDTEGLSTNGVQEAAIASSPEYDRLREDYPYAYVFSWHQNLTHDLYHVLTGYGRDAMGEASVLRFTHAFTRSRGIKFIAHMAGLRVRYEDRGIPAGAILREAARLGSQAHDFVTADFEALFELPVEAVRKRMNIGRPEVYLSVPRERLMRIGAAPEAAPAAEAEAKAA